MVLEEEEEENSASGSAHKAENGFFLLSNRQLQRGERGIEGGRKKDDTFVFYYCFNVFY